MNEITPEMIKEIRERTGVGVSKCKEALALAEGDMQKAIDILRKHGMASAVKKEGRETKEGLIFSANNKTNIVLLEINAETDFVVQNERFKKFGEELASLAIEKKPQLLKDLLDLKIGAETVEQKRNLLIQTFGENIQIKRFEMISKKSDSSYGIYFHMGGKIISIVEIKGDNNAEALAKEVAMHAAAENPDFLAPENVPSSLIEKEKEIARAQIQGKPENIVEKILVGKLHSFYDQVCLLRQKFIKDPSITVKEFVDEAGKKTSKTLNITNFWRWKVGQE